MILENIMEIAVVPESRFQEAILFLRENFPDEPLNQGVRLCEKNVPCELLESHDLHTMEDGLSLMATDPDTGEIAGIALNGISRRGEVEEALKSMGNVENIQYHHIFGLLFNLNKEADLFNKYGIDEIFELRILCVSPKYRGRGIASKLFAASEKIAVERGFKMIKVDATSYFTQKVCESNGLHTVNEINYKKFKDEHGKHIYGKCLEVNIANGNVSLERGDVTTFVHIVCHSSYDIIGPAKVECINGKWNLTYLPKCVARCDPPPFLWNGGFQIEGDKGEDEKFKKGTLVTYTCSPGFYLLRPQSKYRICKDGMWTGVRAYCEPAGCKAPEPIKDGYYVHENAQMVGQFAIGERLHYNCNIGSTLSGTLTQKCLSDGTWSPKIQPKCIDNAAKHSLAGQGLAKSVCKATTEELLGPKKKHLDYLVHCTNEPNVSIPQMANLLIERSQNTSWVVVFKSLITTHHIMCYGNERFTQYLASSNVSFQLSNFIDKTGVQSAVGARTGYDMSPFIRRYAKYLNEKALSYRAVAFDFCKVKRGKEEGTLRTMNAENLLKTLPILQNQLDHLLEFDCTANDLTNGVINMCFMLLFRDLIRLFACYNDGIINLLEKYFEMNKKQCREALDLYKKFLIRMDRVGEFLKVAENIGIDKGDIPDLTKAPNSLLDALEQHLASLEGNTPTAATNQKNLKSGVSALNNTSNAFGTVANSQIDESVKQAAVAEEEAVLNQYKASIGSPNSSSTNPFLSSPTKPAPAPSNQQILDLFGTEPVSANSAAAQPSKAIDDLLQLGNPFADMFQGTQAPPAATNGNLFDTNTTTADFFNTSAPTTSAPTTTNMWANGFAAQPAFAPPTQTQPSFPPVNLSGSLFSTNEPSVFDPITPAMSTQPAVAQQAAPQPKSSQPGQKLLTGDLESSLASLVENLTIDSGKTSTTQWNSPKNQPKQAAGWQPQPMAATTGAMYRPMGQAMGQAPMMYPMGAVQQPVMGSPRLGNPQPQPPKQEVSFDPFGDL
ncbi:ANTH domain [Popillia japonica]|uniref:aralkylamine N-acetyltransferase n=1 Tax=Popillia japonica TaxID=7064 RepID=A0AAW1IUE0_POPJA